MDGDVNAVILAKELLHKNVHNRVTSPELVEDTKPKSYIYHKGDLIEKILVTIECVNVYKNKICYDKMCSYVFGNV